MVRGTKLLPPAGEGRDTKKMGGALWNLVSERAPIEKFLNFDWMISSRNLIGRHQLEFEKATAVGPQRATLQ